MSLVLLQEAKNAYEISKNDGKIRFDNTSPASSRSTRHHTCMIDVLFLFTRIHFVRMYDSDVIRREKMDSSSELTMVDLYLFIVLHVSLTLRHSFTQHALVWSRTSSAGCSLLDVIYHLNLQYLLITDITVGVGRGGGGSGDSGCWLVSHLRDIETL
jgi:hypothetical protein